MLLSSRYLHWDVLLRKKLLLLRIPYILVHIRLKGLISVKEREEPKWQGLLSLRYHHLLLRYISRELDLKQHSYDLDWHCCRCKCPAWQLNQLCHDACSSFWNYMLLKVRLLKSNKSTECIIICFCLQSFPLIFNTWCGTWGKKKKFSKCIWVSKHLDLLICP